MATTRTVRLRMSRACGRMAATLSLAFILGMAGARAADTSAPTPTAMIALQNAHWIAAGSSQPTHVVYVFIDANCSYCHQLLQRLRPYYSQGLQVRNVLVSVIQPSSTGKAVAIMDARDPAAALVANEQHWGSRTDGGGGIAPVAKPGAADTKILDHHLALMDGFGFPGTPGVVYLDAHGKVNLVEGSPGDSQIAQIVRDAIVP